MNNSESYETLLLDIGEDLDLVLKGLQFDLVLFLQELCLDLFLKTIVILFLFISVLIFVFPVVKLSFNLHCFVLIRSLIVAIPDVGTENISVIRNLVFSVEHDGLVSSLLKGISIISFSSPLPFFGFDLVPAI